jgi:KTSC domain-containing protein
MPHAPKHGKVILHPVKSSNIAALGYEPHRQELHVKYLSGHEGHYTNVDANTYTIIRSAPSKGGALHRLVRARPDRYKWVPKEAPTRG